MVTPRMVQLVVIRGRYTPRDLYRAGMNFFKKFSSSCTRMAMTRMKTMVCKYSRPLGARMPMYRGQVAAVAMTMTKVTARDMPTALSNFLDTPRKGQIPRNLART